MFNKKIQIMITICGITLFGNRSQAQPVSNKELLDNANVYNYQVLDIDKNDINLLAFPCNDFKSQEPGSNEEIKNFCSINYDVTFQLFDKISVKDDNKAPLYKMLTDNPVTGKSEIGWNFEKFLINREGNVVKHYRSQTKPESAKIISAIEAELRN